MVETTAGPMTPEAVVAGYLRHSAALRARDDGRIWDPADPDTAAYDALHRLVFGGPAAEAWPLVLALLRATPDGELDVQAAGPLEDLVRVHGAALVGEVEAEAARDERFRWALGCIWLREGDLPPDVLRRVVAASGGAIKPLPAPDYYELPDHAT